MKTTRFLALTFAALLLTTVAKAQQSIERIDTGWKFHLGSAASPERDFMRGTEYFNYLTKAHGIHNTGPYILKFDDSDWQDVKIPHDWVTQLPYASDASHSHGYRSVGWKFPENSVGWYRKVFEVGKADEGKHIEIRFDGIFRNAEVWVNGFFCGQQISGYGSHTYDVSDYLDYGTDGAPGKNVICVRADASLEEGWFYEGAGIYRDVWMRKCDKVHVKNNGTFVYAKFDSDSDFSKAKLMVSAEVENTSLETAEYHIRQTLLDADGNTVGSYTNNDGDRNLQVLAKDTKKTNGVFIVNNPHLWDINDPYLYKVRTEVIVAGNVVDTYETTIGIRHIMFSAEKGFMLNGRCVELKGVNCHQDHAGVGAAIPDALQAWRIKQLKALGCNAYRASHNPMTPALLDVCDREGILVIDENRLMGTNEYHLRELENMIRRDRNHPSVIMWSDGNEEWGLENNIQGTRLAASMREYTHRMDPSRPVTIANAGGTELIKGLEIVGFNYIVQNDVDNRHRQHPEWKIVGTEETTACGTRGVYFKDPEGRWMPSINRTDTTYENIIERGWKFYNERPWAAGLFYWTGFDYKGEPNPMSYPAVGSQFGILDYCGFPKDEAYYLKACWTDETVLHIFPHWNLKGHEGEEIDVWAYSNCDEVELFVNGKSAGRQQMPKDGHLKWAVTYKPGTLKAVGYKAGKRVKQEVIETTGDATQIMLTADRTEINADGRDVAVLTVALKDKKGRIVPTACNDIRITVSGEGAHILGVGNGDSAFKGDEHPADDDCKAYSIPAFNGYAQILIQANSSAAPAVVTCSGDGLKDASVVINAK